MTEQPKEPTNREKLAKFTEQFMARVFPQDAKLKPQQAAARAALLMRADNAHKFAPRHPPHPYSRGPLVIFPGEPFCVVHPKFPYNPMLIARGTTKRLLEASAKGLKRTKDSGYFKYTQEEATARMENQHEAWAQAKVGAGFPMMPPMIGRSLKNWKAYMQPILAQRAARDKIAKEEGTGRT